MGDVEDHAVVGLHRISHGRKDLPQLGLVAAIGNGHWSDLGYEVLG